jgi:hypothetical protein
MSFLLFFGWKIELPRNHDIGWTPFGPILKSFVGVLFKNILAIVISVRKVPSIGRLMTLK